MNYRLQSEGRSGEVFAWEDMRDFLLKLEEMFQRDGRQVDRINFNVAPPDAGLGDVRPSSSGPVSFGIRVSSPIQDRGLYFWAVPA